VPQSISTVSVVIPALNAAGTLAEQLAALREQVGAPAFTTIVVDNGSTDSTLAIVHSFADAGMDIRVVNEPVRGINRARNAGVAATPDGSVVLICDADDVVSTAWVAELSATVSTKTWGAGPLEFARLNSPRTRSLWGGADVMDLPGPTPFRDTGHGSNCGFTKSMWSELGGFALDVVGHGDETEFFHRAWGAGFRLQWAPEAIVHHRQRDSATEMLKRRYKQGAAQARLANRPGYPAEAPRYRLGGVLKSALVAGARAVVSPVTRAPGWTLLGTVALNAGRCRGLATRQALRGEVAK